jgi:hypothetical protein
MENPKRMITTGDNDAAGVKRIQILLNILGCSPVFEDGEFGEKTLRSVKEFQSKYCDEQGCPLKVDGKVGPKTRWSLEQNLNNLINSPAALRLEAVNIARKEIGVKEVPLRSNRGPRVEEYLKSVCLGPGYAWCVAFVYWCFEQSAASLNRVNPLPRTGSCIDHWTKSPGKKIITAEAVQIPQFIQPGTIFIILNRKTGHGHTGIVVGVNGGYIQTIEGNTNSFLSREGNGVIELKRKISDINGGFINYL